MTARSKVLLLIKGLATGGAEMLAVDAARPRNDDDLDHELAYLTPQYDALVPRLTDQGTPVRCYDQRRGWDPRWLLRLRRDLDRPEIAVIHSHSPVPAVGARLMARTVPRSRRPKVVTTLHNTWSSLHPLTRTAYRLTSRLDDAHLSVSEGVHRTIPASIARRDQVVVHGVDVNRIRRAADRAGARDELGVDRHDLVIGTIANLRWTKGYPDLIDAARTVTTAFPRARFVIVGDGPLREELEALRDDAGLTDRMVFTGARLDALRLLSAFDLFCLPSHHEGLPVVLMESMALGVPVVATSVGGIGELITDGVEGTLVPPHRPDLLAEALLALLTADDVRAKRSAAAGRLGDELDTEPATRRVRALYGDLLASGGRPATDTVASS